MLCTEGVSQAQRRRPHINSVSANNGPSARNYPAFRGGAARRLGETRRQRVRLTHGGGESSDSRRTDDQVEHSAVRFQAVANPPTEKLPRIEQSADIMEPWWNGVPAWTSSWAYSTISAEISKMSAWQQQQRKKELCLRLDTHAQADARCTGSPFLTV